MMHRLLFSGPLGLGPLGSLRAAGALASTRNGSALAAGLSVAAVGSVAYVRSWRDPEQLPPKPADARLVLDRLVMEALAGGLGEVASVCVLFPLETIKVRCQAEGLSASVVMQRLAALGLPAAARALYAGFLSAAVCSLIVGGVHYASFCCSRRIALGALQPDASSSSSSTTTSGSSSSSDGHGSGSPQANVFAASVGALATALVESPVELFRHQAQAGHVSGNFIAAMAATVQKQGLPGLFTGVVPFCIESFPCDVVELSVWASLQDWRVDASAGAAAGATRGPLAGLVARMPEQAFEAAAGAAAGACAVIATMPMDVIKTWMQTHGTEVAAAGLGGQLGAFWRTGAKMVATGGVGALFVGTLPRLVQQVPSTTICWIAIERTRALLEPFTKP